MLQQSAQREPVSLEEEIFPRLFEADGLGEAQAELKLAIEGAEGVRKSVLCELLAFTLQQTSGRHLEVQQLQLQALASLESESDRLSIARLCDRISSSCAVRDRFGEAVFYSQRAIDVCPKGAPELSDFLLGLAIASASGGSPGQALVACDERRALPGDNDDLLDHAVRAYALYEAGRLEDAEKAFEGLLKVEFDQSQHDDIVKHLEEIRKRLGRG